MGSKFDRIQANIAATPLLASAPIIRWEEERVQAPYSQRMSQIGQTAAQGGVAGALNGFDIGSSALEPFAEMLFLGLAKG